MKRETIRKLIYQVLTESDDVEFDTVSTSRMTSASRLSDMSVDSQIDSFILGFEKESMMSAEDELTESLLLGSLQSLLLEAEPLDLEDEDEDEEAAEDSDTPDDAAEDEEEATEPGDESEQKASKPASTPMPKINIEAFTGKVMRLTLNAEQILDTSTVVINRAKKFLADNYNQAHIDAFEQFLETNYDLNDSPMHDENPPAPYAVGANPAGAGDMGGG
jgi:hypothetical protein